MSARIEANANPAMLLWARKEKGLDVPAAAKKAALKESKLILLEAGEARPSVAELRKLATVYKRPLSVFFLLNAPEESPLLPDRRRVNSSASASYSVELRMAVREARYRRQVALDLYEELGESPAEIGLRAHLGDDPEALALEIREWLGVEGEAVAPQPRSAFNRWREALEGRGVLVFQARQVEVKEMRGFAMAAQPLPVIAANMKDSYTARSFTLMHELGHVLLGESALCSPSPLTDEEPSTTVGRIEAFCNRLAGAALAPARVLERLVEPSGEPAEETIAVAARRLGVSREVVVRRLLVLGRVTERFYREKRQAYQASFEAKDKKGGRGPSPSALALAAGGRGYAKLVLEAYDEGRITTSDASDYLGVKVVHLDRIRKALASRISDEEDDA